MNVIAITCFAAGLAWHGRDLRVANAPDLTVVRDLDGEDDADEYVRTFESSFAFDPGSNDSDSANLQPLIE